MHTAEIKQDVTVFPLDVTFDAVDPTQSVSEQYTAAGTYTGPDAAVAWASARLQGTIVLLGQTIDIPVGPETLRTTAELEPGDPKHVRVRVEKLYS